MVNFNSLPTGLFEVPNSEQQHTCAEASRYLHAALEPFTNQLGTRMVDHIVGTNDAPHRIEISQNPHNPNVTNVKESWGQSSLIFRDTMITSGPNGEVTSIKIQSTNNETTGSGAIVNNSNIETNLDLINNTVDVRLRGPFTQFSSLAPDSFQPWVTAVKANFGTKIHISECQMRMGHENTAYTVMDKPETRSKVVVELTGGQVKTSNPGYKI